MEEAQNKPSKKAFLVATPTRDHSPTLAQRSSPQSLHAKPTFSRVCFAVPRTRPISTRFRALLASLDAASRRNNTRRAPKAPRRHREQAARDESPSTASRLRDVRDGVGHVRRATGVAPGRPQLPQGVGPQGARAAACRRAPRAGRRPPTGYPSARAVWRAPSRTAPRPQRRRDTRASTARTSPSAPRRRAAPRTTSSSAPPTARSSRATATPRPARRGRSGAPRTARRRDGLRRARSPPAETPDAANGFELRADRFDEFVAR